METEQPVAVKKNNLPLIIGAVAIVLCCCVVVVGAAIYLFVTLSSVSNSVTVPLPNDTQYLGNADELLRSDTLKAIADHEYSQTGCSDVTLFSGVMNLAPDQTSDGSWSEVWEIDACGDYHKYDVVFTPTPDGGTDFSVTPSD